jgi:hypothetical protein
MNRFFTFLIVLLGICCSTDKEQDLSITLDDSLSGKQIERDNVIACAASNENDNLISVYFYPRNGVTNIRYYETENSKVDKNDFENYYPVEAPQVDVFNGYLKKFEVSVSEEKWVIVSFDESGKTHLSNPIRLKQDTKPTEYLSQNVSVDGTDKKMPIFSWKDGKYADTKIYFQVVSDAQNQLLSGTYTFEKVFQYYNIENVVLNITKGTPETLKEETSYGFTLMAVSEDNWVNLFSKIDFEVN